jgi:hypothetical protein
MGLANHDFNNRVVQKMINDSFINDIFLYDNGRIVIVYSYTKALKKTALEKLIYISSPSIQSAPPIFMTMLPKIGPKIGTIIRELFFL